MASCNLYCSLLCVVVDLVTYIAVGAILEPVVVRLDGTVWYIESGYSEYVELLRSQVYVLLGLSELLELLRIKLIHVDRVLREHVLAEFVLDVVARLVRDTLLGKVRAVVSPLSRGLISNRFYSS